MKTPKSIPKQANNETPHLLRSQANGARLKAAMEELDKTGGTERKLAE